MIRLKLISFMNIFTKRVLIAIGTAAATLAIASGCAKETSEDNSGLDKSYLEAWMNIKHPGISPSGLGIYVLEDTPGTGAAVTDEDFYYFVDYTVTDLDGNISATTSEKLAQRVGTFSQTNYYGPDIFIADRFYTEAGVLDMISGMRVGGTRTAVIPGWLNVNLDYETGEEYEKRASGTNVIYTVSLRDKAADITKWEIDSLERYVSINMAGVDSTKFGYYSRTIKAPTDTATFKSDTNYFINYTGRLLNGKVFDTTIEDTAKVHGIYSASKTYAPMYVTPAPSGDGYKSVTISTSSTESGNTVVDGFAYCLSKIRPHEKVVCVFYSSLGYGYSGKSPIIPKFAPLIFEIEVVDGDTGLVL